MQCPSRLKGDSNNSDSFKVSLEYQTDLRTTTNEKTDKLIRYVHARIEEKFKDFRQAFRGFDKNYDGTLSFKEFISGLENLGIRLQLEDFERIFKYLDKDGMGEIDFEKFCHLNIDKTKDTHNYLNELKRQFGQEIDENTKPAKNKGKARKPPLPQIQRELTKI